MPGSFSYTNPLIDKPVGPSNPAAVFGNPATFTAAANTQASDYDTIMKQYADLAKSYSANPITAGSVVPSSVSQPNPVTTASIAPQLAPYQQSADVTSALGTLKDLSTTGGYTPQGIADIRARAVSPTRSIYSSAQQNVERAKALSGGYSPNFGAVQAKMARDESNAIAGQDTAAEAQIAQNVAGNRIAAASPYASTALGANAAQTESDRHNADIINQINEANASRALSAGEFNTSTAAGIAEGNANRSTSAMEFNTNAALQANLANRSNSLGAIQGQTSLYGTTPALTNTFGNQVIQAGQLGQGQQELNNRKLATFGSLQ